MKKKIEKRANIKANKQRFVSELKKKRCALKNRETKKKERENRRTNVNDVDNGTEQVNRAR